MATTERIVVFFDFQNVHLVGRGLFASGSELYRCVPDPVRIADLIAGKRRRPSVAVDIRVYGGGLIQDTSRWSRRPTTRRHRSGLRTGGSR